MNQLLVVLFLVLARGGKNLVMILLTRRLPFDLAHAVVEWMPMTAIPVNKLVDAKELADSAIGWRRACHDEIQIRLRMCNERITRRKGNPGDLIRQRSNLRFLASNHTYTILLDNAVNTSRERYLDFDMTALVKCTHYTAARYERYASPSSFILAKCAVGWSSILRIRL